MDKRIKQTSILTYWTLRYLIILFLGLLFVATVSFYLLHQTTKMNNLQMTRLFGQAIALQAVGPEGNLRLSSDIDHVIDYRKKNYNLNELNVILINAENDVCFTQPKLSPYEIKKKLSDDLLSARQESYFTVVTPIMYGTKVIGQVIILQSQKALSFSAKEYTMLAALLIGLTAFGWLTIYLLSRKLSRPIREVAAAARLVSHGQYDIQLDNRAKEKEISDLIVSFKEMAVRLKQLEEWKALLLAGVTHELKTPVTSIKGLLHAVREEVVEKKESEEFLDIALHETERMQIMIEDLLDYNAFATGSIEVRSDVLNANQLITEIAFQWKIGRMEDEVELELVLPENEVFIVGDTSRIQQILINLFNNSLQAKKPSLHASILVTLRAHGTAWAEVEVKDNGVGIPLTEQPFVFERYFRGELKKLKTRGLGLGLTFSNILAHALGGEIQLKESSDEGTTFVLRLRLDDRQGK